MQQNKNMKKALFIGLAIIAFAFFAYKLIPLLQATYSKDKVAFWYFIIVFPLSVGVAHLVSTLYLSSNSQTWLANFLKKYIHILFLFISFMLLLVYQNYTNT